MKIQERERLVQKNSKYFNLTSLLYYSLATFLYFGCIGGAKSLLYKTYKEAGYTYLNSISFFANYLVGPTILVFIDYMFNRLRYSVIIYIGSFYTSLFVAGGLLVMACDLGKIDPESAICNKVYINTIIVVSTSIGGFLSTIFFISQTVYITYLSDEFNRQFYFGIALSIYECSSLFGNLLGYFLIDLLGKFNLYVVAFISALCIQFMILCIKDDRDLSQKTNETLLQSAKKEYKSIVKVLKQRNMKLYIPYIFLNAAVQTTQFQFLPALILSVIGDNQNKNQLYLLFYVVNSIGLLIGGVILGKVAKKIGSIRMGYVSLFFIFVSALSSFYSVQIKSIPMLYIIGLFYGVGYAANLHCLFSILTIQIGSSNQVVCANNFIICMGCTAASVAWFFLNPIDIKASIIFVLCIVSMEMMALRFFGIKIKKELKKVAGLNCSTMTTDETVSNV